MEDDGFLFFNFLNFSSAVDGEGDGKINEFSFFPFILSKGLSSSK